MYYQALLLSTLLFFSADVSLAQDDGGLEMMRHGVLCDEIDEKGQAFISHKGIRYAVLYDDERSTPFFVNTKKFEILYEDPRYSPPSIPITPGAELENESGNWFVLDPEGHKFYVSKDDEDRPYYIDADTKISQWEDPRGEGHTAWREAVEDSSCPDGDGSCINPDVSAAQVESITTTSGTVWYVYYSDSQVPYFLNSITKETQWEDPRSLLFRKTPKPPPSESSEEEEDEYE